MRVCAHYARIRPKDIFIIVIIKSVPWFVPLLVL
jgi:hypothetical protein